MKANELRIGNYYLSAKFRQPVKCSIEDFYELYARCDGAELDEEIIAEIFEPLPLTEERLIEFNATLIKDSMKTNSSKLYSIKYFGEIEIINNIFYLKILIGNDVDVNHRLITLKSTHQFQNIYSSIKGNEA